jgi:hypothetical protein
MILNPDYFMLHIQVKLLMAKALPTRGSFSFFIQGFNAIIGIINTRGKVRFLWKHMI